MFFIHARLRLVASDSRITARTVSVLSASRKAEYKRDTANYCEKQNQKLFFHISSPFVLHYNYSLI